MGDFGEYIPNSLRSVPKEADGLLSEAHHIANRHTLYDDSLLNGLYCIDPYPSSRVVPIEPLANFLG